MIGAPFAVKDFPYARLRGLYDRDYVLVRPDLHTVWRGNALPENPEAVAALVTGFPVEGMARSHAA